MNAAQNWVLQFCAVFLYQHPVAAVRLLFAAEFHNFRIQHDHVRPLMIKGDPPVFFPSCIPFSFIYSHVTKALSYIFVDRFL